MTLLEQYRITEDGYHPFLINDGWQVAQLNYTPEQKIENIKRLDVHHLTDEVFILLRGRAVLIAAFNTGDEVSFELELMRPGVTYNITRGTWHNIAMTEGCETIIIEKSNTHISDFEHLSLSTKNYIELKRCVSSLLCSPDI